MTRTELWEAFGRRRGTLFPLTGEPRYQCRLNAPSCEGFADIPEAAIAAALGVELEEPELPTFTCRDCWRHEVEPCHCGKHSYEHSECCPLQGGTKDAQDCLRFRPTEWAKARGAVNRYDEANRELGEEATDGN